MINARLLSFMTITAVLSFESPGANADVMSALATTDLHTFSPVQDSIQGSVGVTSTSLTTVLTPPYAGTLSASAAGSLTSGTINASATITNAAVGSTAFDTTSAGVMGVTYDFTIQSGPASGTLMIWGSVTSDSTVQSINCTIGCDNDFAGASVVLGVPVDAFGAYLPAFDEYFFGAGSGSGSQYVLANQTFAPIEIAVPYSNSAATLSYFLIDQARCLMEGGICSAAANSSMSILGAQIFDADGNLAPTARLSSASGYAPSILAPVPEPGSLALLATVLITLGCVIRHTVAHRSVS
jgi:hypothetical protein